MPITSSAQKKLRRDQRFTVFNRLTKFNYRTALKAARLKPTQKSITAAFSALDLAAKKSVIHKNKASRLKSRLAKLLASKTKIKPASKKKPAKTSSEKI